MAEIGERAELQVVRETPIGLFLDAGGGLGEVLLPRREVPPRWRSGEALDVFLYLDSEDRPVATCKRPTAMPGEFALLRVVDVTAVGCFLDWGLPKDLLLPFGEQRQRAELGRSYVVRVLVDEETDRIIASRRIGRFLSHDDADYGYAEEVDLLPYARTDLGFKAIINGRHQGIIYANETFRPVKVGEPVRGFVREVREDGRIDLTLHRPGFGKVSEFEQTLLDELDRAGGSLALGDKSPPEEISEAFGVSKKVFKQAIGALYRKRLIRVEPERIEKI